MTTTPKKPAPESSTNLIVGLVLGIVGALLSMSGAHFVGLLLGLAALVVTIVGFARNEQQRVVGVIAIVLAIIAMF